MLYRPPGTVQVGPSEGAPPVLGGGNLPGPIAADPGHRHHPWALLVLLTLGAAVRLALWACFAGLPPSIEDERDYNALACNLVLHGEYAFQPGQPDSLRPPLYPALVAGAYRLFGLENYQAVRLLQAALSLLTVLLAYRLGTALYSPRVGLWAAGLCCFYPSLLGFNNLLLTEVLFTFLLSAFCLLFVRGLQRDSLPALALAGVLLALAALTRSVVWLFPPVLAVFLLLAFRAGWRRRLLAAAVLTAGFAAVLAHWVVRNTRLQRTFVAVDVMGGRNFMMGNYAHTPLYRSWAAIGLQGEQSWIREVIASSPQEERDTQGKLDKAALRHGLRFVVAHPGLTLRRDLVKFFDFWGLERELIAGAGEGYFGRVSRPVVLLLALAICGSYVAVLFAGLFGIVLTPPAGRPAHLFLLLVIAFVCGMHTLVFGHSRYHLPLMPLVMVYAAGALVHRKQLWLPRRPAFWLACCLCALFLAGWTWDFLVVDWVRIQQLLGTLAAL